MIRFPRQHRRLAPLAITALLAAASLAAAQSATRPAPSTQPAVDAPERQQWEKVQQARKLPPKSEPYTAWFAAARQQRQKLLDAVGTYLVLYPGGRFRDEAIRLQLSTLFEVATLHGESLEALETVVDNYLQSPPSPAAEAEAAYWKILCKRDVAAPPEYAHKRDPRLANAYARYIRTYPTSRHTPRLTTILFEQAAAADNLPDLRRLVRHLEEHFPQHATTALLTARLQRRQRVGQPVTLSGTTLAGETLSTAQYNGHTTVFVFWAGHDAESRTCVGTIEAHRQAHPDLRAVGLLLDESAAQARKAIADLELPWPQLYDRLTWGGHLARNWGVHRVPTVLVIDDHGRLLGSVTGDDWPAWRRLLDTSPPRSPATTRPTTRPTQAPRD